METTTLATFRIDKKTWKKFKKWARDKNSNASAELNQFVLRSLGLIDENLDTENNNNLEQCIDTYLDNNLGSRIEEAVNKYLEDNLEKHIDDITTQYVSKEQDTDLVTNSDKNIDVNIDNNLDSHEVEELDTYIDKEEPLEEPIKEQLTNAELARRIKVSPSTVSRWATQKRQPPTDLEWEYDPKVKKWVN